MSSMRMPGQGKRRRLTGGEESTLDVCRHWLKLRACPMMLTLMTSTSPTAGETIQVGFFLPPGSRP